MFLNLFFGWQFYLLQFSVWYVNNLGGNRFVYNFLMKDAFDLNYGPVEWFFPYLEINLAWLNNNFFRYYYATDFEKRRVIFAGDKSIFDKSIFGNKSVSLIAQGPEEIVDGQEEWYEGPVWDSQNKQLFFSDVFNDKIYRWNNETGKELFMDKTGGYMTDGYVTKDYEERPTAGSSGLAIKDGYLYIC